LKSREKGFLCPVSKSAFPTTRGRRLRGKGGGRDSFLEEVLSKEKAKKKGKREKRSLGCAAGRRRIASKRDTYSRQSPKKGVVEKGRGEEKNYPCEKKERVEKMPKRTPAKWRITTKKKGKAEVLGTGEGKEKKPVLML